MTAALRFDVYGRRVAVERRDGGWVVFLLGAEGKRRRADFEIPDFVVEGELLQHLADLFHEAATPEGPGVRRLP